MNQVYDSTSCTVAVIKRHQQRWRLPQQSTLNGLLGSVDIVIKETTTQQCVYHTLHEKTVKSNSTKTEGCSFSSRIHS